MRRNAFLGYFLVQVIVIGLVMASFRFITDRQIAATVAGVMFVGVPCVLMALELRRAQLRHRFWFLAVLQFWLFFALPILGLRLSHWGVPFESLSFLGIPGPELHRWSSKSYMVMMGWTLWEYWKLMKTSPEMGPMKIKKPV